MRGLADDAENYPPYLPFAMYKVIIRGYQLRNKSYTYLGSILANIEAKKNTEIRPKRPSSRNYWIIISLSDFWS